MKRIGKTINIWKVMKINGIEKVVNAWKVKKMKYITDKNQEKEGNLRKRRQYSEKNEEKDKKIFNHAQNITTIKRKQKKLKKTPKNIKTPLKNYPNKTTNQHILPWTNPNFPFLPFTFPPIQQPSERPVPSKIKLKTHFCSWWSKPVCTRCSKLLGAEICTFLFFFLNILSRERVCVWSVRVT